jgi:pimeloyl-ACP methyl ester carboxylesterase
VKASYTRREGEGPPLLLLHGAGANERVWEPLFSELSSFDVIAPSLPGRLASEGDAFDRASEAAAWIDALLEDLGARGVIALGHSYGGAIAIELALRSEKLAGLVLVSSGARLRVHPSILEGAAHAIETRVPLALGFAFTAHASKDAILAYERAASVTPPEATLADWRGCDSFDRMEDVSSITVPALVAFGADDALTPAKYHRALADRLPRAELACIDGAGHMLPWEKPRELASALRAWASAVT